MEEIAKHDGTVTAVNDGVVTVHMHVVSACSSCEAHEKCAFVDQAVKEVHIETAAWKNYTVGDKVVVCVGERLGLKAVMLAYFVPAVLLIVTIVCIIIATGNELMAAVAALGGVALYYLVLYLKRNKLKKQFHFELE
ncbi:MAG: SoxR reducing system RseC family protein [Bacteroidales bacterium]|nr:SoxR reducing system RseC family protein [Bacteroidales bacterium]